MKYLDLAIANEQIKTTDIKGKEYAEVNQRIKAFRMVYPQGIIETDMVSNNNGVCIFRAYIRDKEGNLLATGTAYEKEDSTFINKTSYIENCETSAVGRALGMCGFGIDVSVASAEEVQNAIENQIITKEDAESYTLTFGKYKGKKLNELPDNYLYWLNENNEQCKQMISLLGLIESEEEQDERLELLTQWEKLIYSTNTDREKIYEYYGVENNYQMTNEQLKDAISVMESKNVSQ